MEQTQEFWKLVLNGNHLVPLADEKGATFVDANCLFGEYVMDLANEFPNVQVIGIGKEYNSPMAKPENCAFIVEDVVKGINISSNSCKFVQSRDVALWMKEDNWVPYLAELYRILEENAWIQVIEMDVWRDYPSGEGGGFRDWSETVFPALASTKGICVHNLNRKLLESATAVGFTDISPLHYEIPVGHWERRVFGMLLFNCNLLAGPKFVEAGKRLRENLLKCVETKRALLFSIVMDRMQAEILIASARGELYDDNFRALHHV